MACDDVKGLQPFLQNHGYYTSDSFQSCRGFCHSFFLTLVHLLQRLAEKDSDAPESESVANKEKKKITFADEAGEALCHVRFFENKSTTCLEPDTEKPEVLN